MTATGWRVTGSRYVRDEVPGWSSNPRSDDVPGSTGAELPARDRVSPPQDGSRSG